MSLPEVQAKTTVGKPGPVTREQGTRGMWIHVDTCGYMWMHVDTCGYRWIQVDTCGYMWIHVDTCGYIENTRQGCLYNNNSNNVAVQGQ